MATAPATTGALTCAPSIPRRAILGGFAAIPLLAAPAIAINSDFDLVLARFWREFHALNALPTSTSLEDEKIVDDRYGAAYDALVDERPQTSEQFARKFYALWLDGGRPVESTVERMLADAQRLNAGLN